MSDAIFERYGLASVFIRDYFTYGWHRRSNNGLDPIAGWRLALHRILWGFSRLTFIEEPFLFTPFDKDGRLRHDLSGFLHIGAMHE
jgi:hypothetical protein